MASTIVSSWIMIICGLGVFLLAFWGSSKTRSRVLTKLFIGLVIIGILLLGYGGYTLWS